MPLQNRVTPFGDIVAHSAYGTMMGNRGILHDEHQRLGTARWRHYNWVNCVLSFRGRHRTVMTPGRYTELFFLDEAVALAAGHRPCGECRRPRYRAYLDIWAKTCRDLAPAKPTDVDRALHRARIDPATKTQRRIRRKLSALPDGAFVAIDAVPLLLWGDNLLPYESNGYGPPISRPSEIEVIVLTPEPTLRILSAGYRPEIAWPR